MPLMQCPTSEQLAAFQTGNLDHDDLDQIVEHLETCDSCQTVLETGGTVSDALLHELKLPQEHDPFIDESGCHRAIQHIEAIQNADATHTRDETADNLPPVPGPMKMLGKYHLHESIGHGGMGDVYKATHTVLKKVVAVKLLPPGRMQNPDAVTRFRREIEAAGRLDHPHIVRASDADCADGQHFLVMEWLDGQDLAHFVRAHGPLPVPQACDFIRQAALGLACAHQHGLVHRDVKPSNLMVTTVAGQQVVKVLDLGLALLHDNVVPESELTSTGQVMGTYDFISPEQAMESHTVDARADMYSLGCTFYYLLTGHPPFPGKNEAKKLLAHQLDKPTPISDYRNDVSKEVMDVVAKMMAKGPAKRYQTMTETSQVLQRLSDARDNSTAKSPIDALQQAIRPWQSILIAVGLLAVTAALLATILVIIRDRDGQEIARIEVPKGGSAQIQDQNENKELKKKPSEVRKGNSENEAENRIRVAHYLANARMAQEKKLHDVAIAECTEALRLAPKNFDVFFLRAIVNRDMGRWKLMREDAEAALEIDPSHIHALQVLGHACLNTGDPARTIGLCDEIVHRDKTYWGAYVNRAAAYSDFGQFETALGDVSKALLLHPVAEHWFWRARLHKTVGNDEQAERDRDKAISLDSKYAKEVFTSIPLPPMQRFLGHENGLAWKVAFSSKGDLLYSCGNDPVVRCWEVATGKERMRFEGHTGDILAIDVSPDDKWLVSGSRDGTARVWNAASGKEVCQLEGTRNECWGLAFARDSRRVVGDGGDNGKGRALVWDVMTGAILVRAEDHANVAAFHPNGNQFLGGTDAGRLQVFDAKNGKIIRAFVGHNRWIRKVALSPNGNTAAAVSCFTPFGNRDPQDENFVALWDWTTGEKKNVLMGHSGRVFGLAFSPNNQYFASGGWDDNTVRIWNLTTAKEIWRANSAAGIVDLAYAPGGREIAAACKDGTVHLWRLPSEFSRENR